MHFFECFISSAFYRIHSLPPLLLILAHLLPNIRFQLQICKRAKKKMPSIERNNHSHGNQTFGRISSGLWQRYGGGSHPIPIQGRNRTRSFCEPYGIRLIDTKLAIINRFNALKKYPSAEVSTKNPIKFLFAINKSPVYY